MKAAEVNAKGHTTNMYIVHETTHTVKTFWCPRGRTQTDPQVTQAEWWLCPICTHIDANNELQEVWHATPLTLEAVNG